jgi:aspartyl-tRNA(Asn)/glutamyl-tRNA(Gln) amidotransferase subunit A
VAHGGVRLSIGTDTLGSVRIPAALCGVVGFKPSHGALPARGVAPLYPQFDTVGLICASLRDLGPAYRALAGSSVAGGLPRSRPDPPRILLLAESALAEVEPDVAAHYRRCCELLRHSPHVRVNELPPCDFAALARAALWRVAGNFAARLGFSSRAFSDQRARLGQELLRLLERAVALPTSKFAAGDRIIDQAHRQLLADTMKADGLLTPTCPVRAIRVTAEMPRTLTCFVVPANVAGLPAVSWPQTIAERGETLAASCSLQLIGRTGCDAQLIDLAVVLQALLGGEASPLGGPETVYPIPGRGPGSAGSAH